MKLLLLFISLLLYLSMYFTCSAQSSSKCIQIFPTSIGQVGKYQRIEYGFELPYSIGRQIGEFVRTGKKGLNPFHPEQVDLRVELLSPSGKKTTRFAFYYEPFKEKLERAAANSEPVNSFQSDTTSYPFRFRFCPDEVGAWEFTASLYVQTKLIQVLTKQYFSCITSSHKGPLQVDLSTQGSTSHLLYKETNEAFFAIGENLASGGECGYFPSQNARVLDALTRFASQGGNFTRFELGGQSALPDWPNVSNYAGKLDEMFAFDKLIAACEDKGIYFTLFRHHVEVWDREDWALVRWGNNPYATQLGMNIESYFNDPVAIQCQQNTLRYIFSRWGYSTNMSFYSYSEVDNWMTKLIKDSEQGNNSKDGGTKTEQEARIILTNWIAAQQEYIRKELNPNMLFCHSPARLSKYENDAGTSFFHLSDVIGIHNYDERKQANFIVRYNRLQGFYSQFKKPVLLEEMGPNKIAMFCCTGIEFHNSLWATSFMGGLGTGMDWWWDAGVFDFGYDQDFRKIAFFFKDENFRKGYSSHRWSDRHLFSEQKGPIRKRSLETIYLVSEEGDRSLGWVHHAGFYWRNLADTLSCLQHLVDNQPEKNVPCYFAQDPFGHPYSQLGLKCPIEHNDVYHHEEIKFDDPKFQDIFTEDKLIPIEGKNMVLEGFKKQPLRALSRKSHWYEVKYYVTNPNDKKTFEIVEATRMVKASWNGKIHVLIPRLDYTNPDYAYKVSYLGFY